MSDLYTNVIPQYAYIWEQLGLKLGLEDHDISNTLKDNARSPSQSEECCADMLKKWLRKIPSPTWGKLEDAINAMKSRTICISVSEGMMHCMCIHTLCHIKDS